MLSLILSIHLLLVLFLGYVLLVCGSEVLLLAIFGHFEITLLRDRGAFA